ncbi:MAG: TauD/TfdA dioxygenase family protein [Burkholderiaceae bacterium]
MPITISPMTEGFAAEVGDLDLAAPLTEALLTEIREAFVRYAVLIFPGQILTVQQHLDFARTFGPLERSVATLMPGQKLRVREEIADVGNLTPEGKVWEKDYKHRLFQLGNRLWHTDSSFKTPTGYTSMLYCRSVAPIGGHTEFADLRAAWDGLAQDQQDRALGLVGEHSLLHSRKLLGYTDFSDQEKIAWAPVPRPLVRTLPESGRRTLYLASHVGRIQGMNDEAGAAVLAELTAHATQRQFTYLHRWRLHDLVLWDNRCTMHRGTPFDDTRYPRDMQRATTSDRPDAMQADLARADTGIAQPAAGVAQTAAAPEQAGA